MEQLENNSMEENNLIKKFKKKEVLCYKRLTKFYKTCDNKEIEKMISIATGKSNISLRILDWFVTRYSRKKKVIIGAKSDEDMFDVHISYKSQLKTYKKKYFDPFKRSDKDRSKFLFIFDDEDSDKKLITTLGQLNFFRWAISNNIVEYVEENYDEIIKEMNVSNKEDKRRKKDKQKIKQLKKVHENKQIDLQVDKYEDQDEVKIILKFD